MSIGAISGFGGGSNMPSINEMRQKMFNRMDQDGDGVISASECESAANDMSQKTGLSITADEMMSIFDLNQDGSITQSEQAEASEQWEKHMASLMEEAGMRPMGPPPPPREGVGELSALMDKIFAAMDTDGDGSLSKTEYEATMEQLGDQSASATASSGADSSTSASGTSAAASTDATSSTEGNTLSALLAQFLDLLAMMEKNYSSQYSQESQKSQNMNSYA